MKQKKSSKLLIITLCFCLCICCLFGIVVFQKKKPEIEAKKDPLTQEEIQWLITHDKTADKEQVEKGIVTNEQRELLKRYEYAMLFMRRKYFTEDFYVKEYDSADPNVENTEQYTEFTVTTDEANAKMPYKVRVTADASDEEGYRGADNYYVNYVIPDLNGQMKLFYTTRGAYVDRVETELEGELREDNLQAEQIIKGEKKEKMKATITLDNSIVTKDSFNNEAELVEKMTNAHKLRGDYTVVLPSQTDITINTDTYTFSVE